MEILCCQWFNFELPIGWSELSVIATGVMAMCTLCALWISRKQLAEMIRAYRARIEIKVIVCKKNYLLEVKNVGIYAARKVTLKFNDDFISVLPNLKCMRDTFNQLQNNPFMIEGGGRKLYLMMPMRNATRIINDTVNGDQVEVTDEEIDLFVAAEIHITGSYLNTYKNKTTDIDEHFKTNEFFTTYALSEDNFTK